MKKILLAAAIIAAMASCSKSNNETPQGTKPSNEIKLSAGVDSKSAITNLSAIEGLRFLRIDAATTPASFATTPAAEVLSASRAASGAITFGNKQYFNTTTSLNTYFVSYYPAGVSANNVVTWDVDAKTDILTSKGVTDAGHEGAPTNAAITYQHELAQLQVTCKAATGALAAAQARFGNITYIKLAETESQMTYSYATMTTAKSGAKTDVDLVQSDYQTDFAPVAIPAEGNTTVTAAGMFIPNPISNQITLKIGTALGTEKTVIVTFATDGKFDRSKNHKVELTFNGDPTTAEITVSASTIEDWTAGSTGSGIIN